MTFAEDTKLGGAVNKDKYRKTPWVFKIKTKEHFMQRKKRSSTDHIYTDFTFIQLIFLKTGLHLDNNS